MWHPVALSPRTSRIWTPQSGDRRRLPFGVRSRLLSRQSIRRKQRPVSRQARAAAPAGRLRPPALPPPGTRTPCSAARSDGFRRCLPAGKRLQWLGGCKRGSCGYRDGGAEVDPFPYALAARPGHVVPLRRHHRRRRGRAGGRTAAGASLGRVFRSRGRGRRRRGGGSRGVPASMPRDSRRSASLEVGVVLRPGREGCAPPPGGRGSRSARCRRSAIPSETVITATQRGTSRRSRAVTKQGPGRLAVRNARRVLVRVVDSSAPQRRAPAQPGAASPRRGRGPTSGRRRRSARTKASRKTGAVDGGRQAAAHPCGRRDRAHVEPVQRRRRAGPAHAAGAGRSPRARPRRSARASRRTRESCSTDLWSSIAIAHSVAQFEKAPRMRRPQRPNSDSPHCDLIRPTCAPSS